MKKIFTLPLLFAFAFAYSQTIILPATGVQSTFSGGCPIGSCSGTLLDPGGTSNYPLNVNNIYQTICPTTPGNCLMVTFSAFNTENGFDYLTIGNGPAQNSAVFIGAPANAFGELTGNLNGSTPFSYTANNSSGCLTFRFYSDFITTRAGFTASITCVPCATAQPAGNSDACSSTFLCSNLGINDVSNGPGTNVAEGCGGSSCVTGENYSNWYTFSVASSGSLTFSVSPNTASDDFDYALFGPNIACGALGAPVRCSYAANTGNTGLGNGAVDVSEDVNGNGWTAPINVTAGQTYKLLVNNWTAGGAGFNLLFGGTATIGTLPPAVNSPSICEGQSAILTATPAASGGTYTWTPGGASTESISVSPTTNTSYSVAYSLSGCTSTVAVTTVTVNSIPTANAGSSATITCTNPSVSLSGSGGGTYAWTGPGIVSGSNTATPSVNAPGTYSLSVTSPAGCTSTLVSTVGVSQNTTVPTPTAGTTGTLTCATPTAALTGGPSSGVSYQWSGPGFSGGTTSQDAIATAVGSYTLKVTDAVNGCTNIAVTSVTGDLSGAIATASSTGSLTCSTTTVLLTGGPSSGATYTWTGPGFSGGVNSQNAIATAPGNYSLTVTGTNGCTNTAVTSVSQNITPPTTIASATGSVTCITNTVALNSSLAGMNYTWTAPAGGTISGGVNSQNAVASGIGVYSLTVINPVNDCSYSTTVAVNQNITAPTGVSAGSNQTLTCTSASVTLSASASTPTNVTFNWDSGVCGSLTNATTSACAAGIYTVTATDPLNGCTATSTVQVFPNSGAPTATISSTALVLDCNNTVQTVTVTSTPNTDVTYNWNNTPASVSANGSIASFTSPNTYICTVTNTISNCSTPVQVVVTSNTTVPTTTATVSGALTCVTSTVVLNSTLAGMDYTWTAPAGGNVVSPNTQSTNASGAGNYSLTVVDPVNGCSYTTNVTVTQNITAPTGVSAGTNQTLTCTSSSVALNGSVSTPTNASVNWTGPGVCGVATNLSSAACAAGNYTLTVTDPANGCSATSMVDVFPNSGAPTATITSTALTLDCNNPIKTVTVTSTPSTNVTYSWNIAPLSTTMGGSVASFSNAGTYICTVTNTVSNCSVSVQVVVTTNTTAPSVTISPSPTLTCTNPTAVISTTVIPGTGVTYTWVGSGIVSGQGTGTIMVNQAGGYGVIVTDNTNGCSKTASVQVISGANVPVVSITATSSNSVITCQNNTVSLTANVTPAGTYSYAWSSGGNNATENVTVANTYSVVVLNSATGCTATSTPYVVGSNTTPPGASANNTIIPCGVPSVVLNANSGTANVSYSWATSGTGTLLSGANTASPLAGSPGQYVVTVTDNTNGCSSTATVNVTTTSINAAFSANPTSGTAPLLVNFSNQTPGTGNIYSWNFGDNNNNTSALTNPDHTYNTVGNYIVTLIVTDASGLCSSTATLSIDVFEGSALIVPNVFTPNGDGKNDVFRITSTGMKDLNCDIFNRWGTKVYTISTVSGYWDGSNVSDGTFFYVITCTGLDGKEYKQQGYLNLFR